MISVKAVNPIDPCPFCGAHFDHTLEDPEFGEFCVWCPACLTEGPLGATNEEAIALWNRRATDNHHEDEEA